MNFTCEISNHIKSQYMLDSYSESFTTSVIPAALKPLIARLLFCSKYLCSSSSHLAPNGFIVDILVSTILVIFSLKFFQLVRSTTPETSFEGSP